MSELERELHRHDLAMEREQELKEKNKKREYFWDFNTVEQVLLSCAILVCLSGVMFESDRFSNDKANRYIWQRTFLTYCVILVVVFSLCYYFAVFMSEVMGYTPGWVKKCLAKRQRGMHLHMSQLVADGDRKNEEANNSNQKMHFDKSGRRRGNSRLLEVEMADLAAQGATGSAVTNPLQRHVHQAEKKAEKKNDDNIEDEISLAVKDESERTEDAWNSSRSTTNAQKSKKGFGQTIARGSAAGVTDDAQRLSGLGVDSSRGSKKKLKSKRGKNKKSVQKKKIVQKEEEPPSSPSSSKKIPRQDSKRRPSFRAHEHKETGQEYYQNEDTGETQWTVPEDAEIIGRPKQSKQRKSMEKKEFHPKKIHTKEDEDVQIHVDPKSKRRYSYSSKSGSTEWLDAGEEEEKEKKKDPEWETHVDPTTKRRYSAHVKTGETKWEDEHPEESSTAATVQRYQDQKTGAWYEVDADGNTKWL